MQNSYALYKNRQFHVTCESPLKYLPSFRKERERKRMMEKLNFRGGNSNTRRNMREKY